MITIYNILYVKELGNIDELFEKERKLPNTVKYIIYFIKKLFCILTITKENMCIIPYKKIKINFITNLIAKLLMKSTKNVVLSNYLNSVPHMRDTLNKTGIYTFSGKILANFLLYDCIKYVSKTRNEDIHSQEVYLLINKINKIDEQNIIFFANHFKRINIVTNNIKAFTRIENYLEENFGIAITITNNKRKSLIKAKIIVNLDFNEEMLNSFRINPNSMIFTFNNKVCVNSKLFNGIHIYNYQITYNKMFKDIMYKKFDNKLLYESIIFNQNYDIALKKIVSDNVKIVNLIGKNGIINVQEYKRI